MQSYRKQSEERDKLATDSLHQQLREPSATNFQCTQIIITVLTRRSSIHRAHRPAQNSSAAIATAFDSRLPLISFMKDISSVLSRPNDLISVTELTEWPSFSLSACAP